MGVDRSNKDEARTTLLAHRRHRPEAERAEAAQAIGLHALTLPVIARASTVAAYVSMPSEPGTGPLIDALLARGVRVIVPLSLPDRTMDWVALAPGLVTTTTTLGIPEPDGERLGAGALLEADVVVVPALAVDHAGHRLGRGAGYYDRALGSVTAPIVAITFADELLESVPHEPHDVSVQTVVTPAGIFRPRAT